jgi:hypothetical protein
MQMPLSDAAYGEQKTFREIQQGAPMSSATPTAGRGGGGGNAISFTGLGESSQWPTVPVTDGAQYGPGAGMEALGQQVDPNRADAEWLRKYLPVLVSIADRDDTPPSTKRWVRRVIANMP